MSKAAKSKKELEAECERLRERLDEAEQTLRAIHAGEVDAVLVNTREGEQIFTLESAERPYRLLVEEMQQGALTVSADGTILYCNRFFAELLRRPRERVIFCSLFHFVDPLERPRLHALIHRGATEISQGEFAVTADDGTHVPVFIASNPLPTSDVPSICLVVTDLTMRKEQERLSAAKEASEQANRAKDQFLAALSHELRTPLTPVLLSSTDLINRLDVPPQVRSELEMIRRNIELEARLIDDLLDLTRISRGKMQLSMQENDAHALIRSALAICQADIDAKQQSVSLQFEARRCHVKGDPARLHQVYWNLIKNAVKFTPNGGEIIIHTYCDARENLIVEVTDSGIGIDPANLPKLFNAFEQGDPTIPRRFGGLGLGLAISKVLVDLQGGTLTARSDGRDRGATFTLAMPTIDPTHAPAAADGQSAVVDLAIRLRILLVEDHADTARSLARLLREMGHSVVVAANVQDAIRATEDDTHDLVISDLGLPDGTGHDLVRRLRNSRPVKAIAVSGYGMESDVARSYEAGFLAHLTKPIKFNDLAAAIARVFRDGAPSPDGPGSRGPQNRSSSNGDGEQPGERIRFHSPFH